MSFACQYLNLPLEVCRILSPLSENLRTTVVFFLWRTTDLLLVFALVTGHQFIKTPEPLASLGHFFKLEWVSCLLLTVYYTAFCFPLQSSACCPQPMERSLCTLLLFFWGLAATFFFAITSLTRCYFYFFFFSPITFQDSKLVLQLHFNLTGQFFSLFS